MESLTLPSTAAALRPPAVAYRVMSDERLVRRAAAGSQEAFAAIFERHHQALHRYCRSLLGNEHDAADALQNTMIKAMRALAGETRQIALRPWLYRIAHNESISLLRTRRPDSDLDAVQDLSDHAHAGVIESRERLRALTEDLSELTERQRGALLMRELGGMEFAEVADALQTTPATAKQTIYEARCALQALQEGRAMDCEIVRRTLSDGDRRMLRGKRIRGHLRACVLCRDFQTALGERPAQLAALAPPLPLAAASAMLHGLLGGAINGSAGGLAAALTGGTGTAGSATIGTAAGAAAGTAGALSLAAKAVAIAVVIGGGTVAGGAAIGVGGQTTNSGTLAPVHTAPPGRSPKSASSRAGDTTVDRTRRSRPGSADARESVRAEDDLRAPASEAGSPTPRDQRVPLAQQRNDAPPQTESIPSPAKREDGVSPDQTATSKDGAAWPEGATPSQQTAEQPTQRPATETSPPATSQPTTFAPTAPQEPADAPVTAPAPSEVPSVSTIPGTDPTGGDPLVSAPQPPR